MEFSWFDAARQAIASIWVEFRWRRLRAQHADRALVLREALPEDVQRVRAYMQSHPSPNLGIRSAQEYMAVALTHSLYLLERQDEIVAIAGVFHYNQGAAVDFELGSIHVRDDYQGKFGLQRVLMTLGAAKAVDIDRRPQARIFAGVKRPSERSEENIKRAGFQLWTEPPPQPPSCRRGVFCPKQAGLPPGECCVALYYAPRAAICAGIRAFLKLPRIIRRQSERGEVVLIRLGVEPATNPAIRRDLGRWLRRNCADAP